ncbi:hypothetical protein ACFP1Z_25365 [Streptomyces gamaensis]|uniref:Secreted protein n=1 Tax=Streptomyces gamaensis TaxID=1763542 RepID=A0ABW0Z8W3_9ACTN
MRGTTVTLGSLALVVASSLWAPASQAHTSEAVTCTGHAESRYDPPLALLPRQTRNHADVRYTCTVTPGRTLPASGSFDLDPTPASCVSLSNGHGTETVRYADGRRSEIDLTGITTTRAAGALILLQTGHVTEGRGKGHHVRRTVTIAPTGCGPRSYESAVQLEILP